MKYQHCKVSSQKRAYPWSHYICCRDFEPIVWCIVMKISIRFQNFCFTFHVSYFVIKQLNINHLWKWNIRLQYFILSFMFHFSNLCGSALSLPQRFLNRSLSVFKSLPQCFWIAPTVFLFFSLSVFLNETLKLKMKHKIRMFQPSKALIINRLKHKSETWKQKTPLVKYT